LNELLNRRDRFIDSSDEDDDNEQPAKKKYDWYILDPESQSQKI